MGLLSLGPAARGLARAADEPVKVLQFLTVFAIGGTERHVMTLSRRLDSSRFAVSFACHKRAGEFLPEAAASGRPLAEYRIASLIGRRTLQQQVRFGRDVRRARIDVVHTYGFHPNVFGIPPARLAGAPVVVASIRDAGDQLTPAQAHVQRFVCKLADAVLVNADAIKRGLVAEGYDAGRIAVIGNGISVPPPRAGARTRWAELGVPEGSPVVAVLSRLVPLKGLEYFLEAAASLAVRFPEARFAIIGDGQGLGDGVLADSPYKRELQARATRLGLDGRVLFTGFRLDVPELLPGITVSVLPSLTEGLSNAILESMAAGIPVVATAVGGSPEAVDDGRTGLLVPSRDAAALAHAIGRLLQDRALAETMGRAARQRVIEKFSESRMVRDMERFYRELLERKRVRAGTLPAERSA
jgi:L-malate glycosyltransferase